MPISVVHEFYNNIMMRLSTIKNKKGNIEYNQFMVISMDLIKSALKLNFSENDYLFFLTWFRFRMVFLYKDTIIIANVIYDYDKLPLFPSLKVEEIS